MIPLVIAGTALLVLLSGWLLYPLALAVLPRRPEPPESPDYIDDVSVTVIIATREPPAVVSTRVASLLTTTWPRERLRLVIGVDPNATSPLTTYREALQDHDGVTVVPGDEPGGKAATLNSAMRAAQTDFVVFADSAQQFEPGAIAALVLALLRPGVGGVTGQIVTDAERGVFGVFWRYESALRKLESRAGLVVAVTGAIHALKRSCWRPLPPGLICDDLLIPLNVGRQRLRVEVAALAQARDGRTFTREVQLQRKVRTLTGMLQVCVWEPWVLVPWRHRLWVAFVCHKLIRIATPLLLVVLMSGLALTMPVAWLMGGAVAALLLVATVLLIARKQAKAILAEARWTMRLLGAPLTAAGRAMRGDWSHW